MSYANIKPEYYRMFQPDSPWHAGAPGWKNAPWPGWGENPNLVGPPRLAVEGLGAATRRSGGPVYQQVKGVGEYFQGQNGMGGLGAYYAPKYERAINGLGGCGCTGVGDAAAVPAPSATMNSSTKGALMIGAAGIVLIALCVVPNIWDG